MSVVGLDLTVYNADIFRIKAEVKTENDIMEGEPPIKRVKMEK